MKSPYGPAAVMVECLGVIPLDNLSGKVPKACRCQSQKTYPSPYDAVSAMNRGAAIRLFDLPYNRFLFREAVIFY